MAVMTNAPAHFPRIAACGDSALAVEFSDRIDEATSARVVAMADRLAAGAVAGIREVVPTYRSLLVHYDPAVVRGRDLTVQLMDMLECQAETESTARHIIVPVLYGGETGADLDALAELKEMTRSDLIALHASAHYRVYMIGFAPGFAYLGGLPERLHTPRLAVPRQRIEAGAIGIGGQQASINSVPGPSGWRFIARTPLKLFDPSRKEPFLLRAGDRVRFRAIEETEAAHLDAAVARGEPVEEWAAT
ncbi:KipI family sensor histidine kinase inhibitor [Rhizobium sp. PP-F2F-G38]|uniref:5-oxoprolinase subunit PxpB n=1 Tax=Rhizobium sp. PP-CC-3G-465 TaxID=2135648 RepID=UPI000D936ED8|nr:KipI family sensor histidine kinase inhibitor [Rhizobium sp. PP-WC-1G-195]PYE94800.1 KipI family sensor histidine kinase inhibitor [Rhizobium sp. PP-F2F-G38]TCQ05381.1 KipI family sensor histidine kinase inhibitor [Rhizobium sp. PP-F2F-G36]TCQ26020.1 KipI family sensor histidine kinase inhibitor [Rhizobium sp. PP-CC-3G-465]